MWLDGNAIMQVIFTLFCVFCNMYEGLMLSLQGFILVCDGELLVIATDVGHDLFGWHLI